MIFGILVLGLNSSRASEVEHCSSTIHVFKQSPQVQPYFKNAYGYAVFPQVALVFSDTFIINHVSDPGLVRIKAGEKRGATGTTAGTIVKLSEPHPAAGQVIQIRGQNLGTVTSDVWKTEVIGKNYYDIRFSSFFSIVTHL